MRFPRVGWLAAVVVVSAVFASASAGAGGKVTLVASGLNNPRQVVVGRSGAIYVAEAGKAGPVCLQKDTCVGYSSAVMRVQGGKVARVIRGLVSVGGKDGSFTTGADGVSVARDGTVFIAMTGAPCGTKVPPRARGQVARLLRKSGRGGPSSVANIGVFECTKNPDHTDRNPNPYAALALSPTHAIVVDAGGNAVYDVQGSRLKLLATLPKQPNGAQSVPTSITLGPDKAYYVGEFVGEGRGKPRRNVARVFRIDPAGGKPTVHATGFNAISGLAFDEDGNLFVTEWSINPANQNELRGDVVRVASQGSARTRLGLGKLFAPAGAAVAPNGALYVSNYSVLPASTPKNSPFKGAGGQLVRITLP